MKKKIYVILYTDFRHSTHYLGVSASEDDAIHNAMVLFPRMKLIKSEVGYKVFDADLSYPCGSFIDIIESELEFAE